MHRTNNISQRGVALLVVMVMLLLAGLLVTGALRVAWFNEFITGAEADHQRAFDNAQALLRDAEFDIQGLAPGGRPCRSGAGFEGSCRQRGPAALAQGQVSFPQAGAQDFDALHRSLSARRPSCAQGICVSDGVMPEFWRMRGAELDRMKAQAARYGEFSGAPSSLASNPLLAAKGWYWVEVLPFDAAAASAGGSAAHLLPDPDNPYIFRITAMAEGRKPATRAVVQGLLVWKRVDS